MASSLTGVVEMRFTAEKYQRRLSYGTSSLYSIIKKVALLLSVASSQCSIALGTWTHMGLENSLRRDLTDHSALARAMNNFAGKNPYAIETPGAEPLHLSHGTTTVAIVFDGGVIAAVDSRASMGSFVGSRTTQKVIPVSDYILGTMAGGAADCSFWLRYLGMQAKVFEVRNGRPMSVAAAARTLADTLLGQRGRGLSVGTMIMGYDGSQERSELMGKDSAQLFYVDSEGARVKGRYFSVGSGSTYAYSVLDEGYQPNMSFEEAAGLARRAVRHATYRDAFSGGFINIFVVNASGWSRVDTNDSGLMEVRPSEGDEHRQRGDGQPAVENHAEESSSIRETRDSASR